MLGISSAARLQIVDTVFSSIDSVPDALSNLNPGNVIALGIDNECRIHLIYADEEFRFQNKVWPMIEISFRDGFWYLSSVQFHLQKNILLAEMDLRLREIFKYMVGFKRFACLLSQIANNGKDANLANIYFAGPNSRKVTLAYMSNSKSNPLVLGITDGMLDFRLTPSGGLLAHQSDHFLHYLSPSRLKQKALSWQQLHCFSLDLSFLGRVKKQGLTIHFQAIGLAIEVEIYEGSIVTLQQGNSQLPHGNLFVGNNGISSLVRTTTQGAIVTFGSHAHLIDPFGFHA